MTKKRLAFLGVVLILCSCKPAQTASSQSRPRPRPRPINPLPKFPLDHYKFWKVDGGKPAGKPVMLKGQFDRRPWKTVVKMPEYIANPVNKKRRDTPEQPIQNEKLHYVAYSIDPDPNQPPPPLIEVTNQFGTKRPWRLQRAMWLLVPADKRLEGAADNPPKGDHFVCYAAEGAQAQIPVTLMDQFDKLMEKPEDVRDFAPALFCVPVSKQREGKPTEEIHDERTHLAIYRIASTKVTKPIPISTNDQFGPQKLNVLYSEYLGVPSLKDIPKQ